jgi:hypothetical protein
MSEYYLADQRARERTEQRTQQDEKPASPKSQDVKVTLLGDFLFASEEARGFDPYDNAQGKSPPRDAWRSTRDRG